MTHPETLYVTTREAWRQWLKRHGQTHRDIWLIFYKKHTGQPSLPYATAVEEAICYGWIDTTVRRLDDQRYMQRFTPRRLRSKWSALNRRRAEDLLERGKVAAPGLASIEEARLNGNWEAAFAPEEKTRREAPAMPAELQRALDGHLKARTFFEQLSPGQQRLFMGWVGVAKKKETREKRAKEAVTMLAKGQKLGMK